MPISFTIDRTQRNVRTTVSGPVTVADILAHFETEHREGTLPYTELIDACAVTGPYLSASDLRLAAMSVQASQVRGKFGPRAVVVDSDLVFGLTRMFATFIADYFHIEVFRDVDKASDWLVGKPLQEQGA